MAAKSKAIVVEPDSELGRLLMEADAGPLLLERSGGRYRVERVHIIEALTVEDLRAGYDPEALRAAVEATAGSWADIDGDKLKQYIHRSRTRAGTDDSERKR